MLKPIQEQLYGNIYVFSDSDETLEDIDRRYKYLSIGLKNYTKMKKKFHSDKSYPESVEA